MNAGYCSHSNIAQSVITAVCVLSRPVGQVHVHVHPQQEYFMNVAMLQIPMCFFFFFLLLFSSKTNGLRVNFIILEGFVKTIGYSFI